MTSRARAALLGCAALAAASLWLATATVEYSPRLERERPTTVFDFFSYYRPNAEYGFARMRSGDLPLWNPYHGIGAPFLATLQTGVLYPPNAIHLLLPAQSAFAVLAFAHLMLAALFAAVLARRLGADLIGAMTAGVLFALSRQIWSSVWTPPTLYAAAWMPAVLAAVVAAVDEPGPRRAAALALALGMQILTGWPYTVAMTALAAAVLGGATAIEAARERRRIPLAAIATLALGVGGGVALAAPQLLPAVELMQRSTRAPGALDERTGHSAGEMHDPAAYLRTMIPTGGAAVPGLASPLLAGVAVALGGSRRKRAVVLLGVGLAALAISFPHSTPLYGWVRKLPLFGDFRFPFRYRLVTTLALATCAGIGVSRFEQRGTPRATWVAAGAGAIAVAALALPIARQFANPDTAFPRKRVEARSSLLAELAGSSSFDAQRALLRGPEATGWRSWWRAFGVEKLGESEGIRTLQDLEPLSLATLGRVMDFVWAGDTEARLTGGSRGRPSAAYSGNAKLPAEDARVALLDLLSLRYLVLDDPPAWVVSGWERVESITRPPLVFRNGRALPRAWLASRAEPEPPDPDRALARLADPSFDLRHAVLLDAPPPLAPNAAGGAASGAARIEVDEAERVVIRADATEPAVLVLNDAWYPGWYATLDGEPVPILRANTAFRAVAVPAGAHRVEMRYAPRSFRLGLGAAALAIAALLGSLLAASLRPAPRALGGPGPIA